MTTIAIVEILCAVFLVILYARLIIESGTKASNRYLGLCLFLMILTLLIDASAYTFTGPAYPLALRYTINLLSFCMGIVITLVFTLCSKAFIEEKTRLNPWIFRPVLLVEILWLLLAVLAFVQGEFVTYENGVENTEYSIAAYFQVITIVVMIYIPVVALRYRRWIGTKLALLQSLFAVTPILGVITANFTVYDYTYVYGAVTFVLITEFIYRRQTQEQKIRNAENEVLVQNYARFFALEDDFESLYDVELESGLYVSYDRDEFYRRNISDRIVASPEFFTNLRTNIERVVWEEDREGLYNVQNREAMLRELAEKDHFDYFYRVITENGPMWLKMRLVYKDAGKKNVIVGIFNAEEEMAAQQKEERAREELLQTNLRLFALEDNLESLYDVEMESGHYDVFVKGEFFRNNVLNKLSDPTNYFEELRDNIDAVIYPEDRQDLYNTLTRESIRKELAEKDHFDYYYRILNAAEPVWFRMRLVYKDAEKKNVIIGVFNARNDIEAKQIARQKVQLEAALNAANLEAQRNDLLYTISNSTKWSYNICADDEVCAAYYQDSMLEGVLQSDNPMAWTQYLHPDDQDRVLKEFMAVVRDHTGKTAYDTTYRLYTKKGRCLWIKSSGRVIFHEDGSRELFGMSTDITSQIEKERKQQRQLQEAYDSLSESKLRDELLCEYAQIARWTFGISPEDVVLSSQFDNYSREYFAVYDPVNAMAWTELVHPEDRERAVGIFMETVHDPGGNTQYVDTYRIRDREGSYHWSRVAGKIRFRNDGTRELCGLSVDITEQMEREKEQQRQLEMALEAAESANQSKSNFLFSMSHDIRTPMNAITGFTNMAIKHIDDREKVLDCLEKTQKSSNMLLALINSVLEVSRIDAGQATLEERNGDVFYSFINFESTMQEMARTKDITLSFTFGPIRDRYVYADFSRCVRVFVNVISNAIKYTPEGGTVTVRCEQLGVAKDGYGTYQYTFTDNGIGMSEEFLKHIFDQFAREHNSTVSGIQGSGLGMTVVKSLVDLMKGTVLVESTQGKGTTITIVLPFRLQDGETYTDPVSGEVVSVSAHRTTDSVEMVDFTGRHVLLVEDNELNQELADEILEDAGLIVENAEDGTIAVDMLRRKGPTYYDCILMDIQMPVMNGYEATKAIREMYPDSPIPIIALSANAFAEDKEKSLAAGMNAHIAKPINLSELFSTMAKFL